MYYSSVYKIFSGGPKGGFERTPRTPPAYGPEDPVHKATAYTMISIFYILFIAVLIYHISKKLTDLGAPQYLFNLCRRQGELAMDNGEIEGRERQGSGCDPVPAQPPTVAFVELREPLLTD